MALTSADETDLILPLFRGVQESPRFSTFLERLKRRTGAEYIGLVFRQRHAPVEEDIEFFAGLDLSRMVRAAGIDQIHTIARTHHDRLRPGRVYAAAEFVDHDPAYKAERDRCIQQLGIGDERVVRIVGEDGLNALLIMARSKPCTAADSALLSNLSPYVAGALSNLVQLERQQVEARIASHGLGRAGTGWIAFDRECRVLGFDPETARELQSALGITVVRGDRLRGIGVAAEREMLATAAAFAANADAEAVSAVWNESPRVEALLVPGGEANAAAVKPPTMLAMVRLPREPSPARPARLAELFDLPPREAELAIALCDGLSIAEAAEAMGLTIETARNYSKRLYAKLGVRGQAELVRLVYESSAVLA